MPNPIPRTENIEIKERFRERYTGLTDFSQFMKYSLSFLRKSIRVNGLKISVGSLQKRMKDWKFTQVPWCREGFWIEHHRQRRDIGNTAEHQLGYIYVQEAASMIPPVVLAPEPHETVLDMCASPGSKTTQMAAYMQNNGIIIANDISGMRLRPLGINLQRTGVSNTIITLMQGRFFEKAGIEFDKILLDAPCSGTGSIRKSLKTLQIWNPDMVRRLAAIQRQLADTAFRILKKDGVMVYSTCSVEPEENEEVIDFLVNKYDNAMIEEIELDIKRSSPILSFEKREYSKEIKKSLRIWPQDNDTEGFFVCRIKKSE